MNIWILRYPEPRSSPGAPWKLVVVQRTAEGEESEIDVIEMDFGPEFAEQLTEKVEQVVASLVEG